MIIKRSLDEIIDEIVENGEEYENFEDFIVDYIAFGSFYSSKDLVTNVIDQLEKIRDNYEKYKGENKTIDSVEDNEAETSFMKEIEEIQSERIDKESLVINDIIEHFRKEMYSENFETKLKDKIRSAIRIGYNTCELTIYSEHCYNGYNFYVSACEKILGIKLIGIEEKVCHILKDMLQERLLELGLKVLNDEITKNGKKITIGWN